MTRRCSHCCNNGHNSRTCPTRGGGACGVSAVKLFGVRLTDGSIIKKSASMGNLPALAAAAARLHHTPLSPNRSPNRDSLLSDHALDPNNAPDGYLSDDPTHGSNSPLRPGEKKKGVPWTEEEHRLFLLGLQKLGKGDWRGIARNYVVSRTPTQVASHAQKHFIRQSNSNRRKRRFSLFDMVPDDMVTETSLVQEELSLLPCSNSKESIGTSCPLSLDLSLKTPESDPTAASTHDPIKEHESSTAFSPTFLPGFFPSNFPASYTIWHPTATSSPLAEVPPQHLLIKPIPGLTGNPVNIEELVGISQLSIAEAEASRREPSPLSLKLVGESTRASAFRANNSDLSKDHSPIQAV